MASFSERLDTHCGDIPRIDEARPALARGNGQNILVPYFLKMSGTEILHKETRPEERVVDSRPFQMPFDLPVRHDRYLFGTQRKESRTKCCTPASWAISMNGLMCVLISEMAGGRIRKILRTPSKAFRHVSRWGKSKGMETRSSSMPPPRPRPDRMPARTATPFKKVTNHLGTYVARGSENQNVGICHNASPSCASVN